MSEIRATTVSDAAGTGPATLTGQSAAKAWVHYEQLTPSIIQSFNVSSVTDSGTGDSTSNYTSALDDIKYPCPTNNSLSASYIGVYSQNLTVSTARVLTRSDSTTNVDSSYNLIQAGDLA